MNVCGCKATASETPYRAMNVILQLEEPSTSTAVIGPAWGGTYYAQATPLLRPCPIQSEKRPRFAPRP